MALIEDTRNKPKQHVAKNEHFEAAGERVVRCALPVGDYARPPLASVDTKRDLKELAQDLIQDHERFERECMKARDLEVKLVILVENTEGVTNIATLEQWSEDEREFAKRKAKHKNARRIHGRFLAKRCGELHKKYGVMFGFCSPEEAGARVLEILDRLGGEHIDH